MKADEIRHKFSALMCGLDQRVEDNPSAETLQAMQSVVQLHTLSFLSEIAAQLAELNERFVVGNFGQLDRIAAALEAIEGERR